MNKLFKHQTVFYLYLTLFEEDLLFNHIESLWCIFVCSAAYNNAVFLCLRNIFVFVIRPDRTLIFFCIHGLV